MPVQGLELVSRDLYRFLRRRHLEDLVSVRRVLNTAKEGSALSAALRRHKRDLQYSLWDVRLAYYKHGDC